MKRTPKTPQALNTLEDMDLIALVLAGNAPAWEELLVRYRKLIYRCIHNTLRKFESVISSEAAEEIFSDVCFNLLRNDMRRLRSYDPARGTKLGSWIGLISVNSSYDYLRRCSRRPMLDQLDGIADRVDPGPTPYERVLKRQRWNVVESLAQDFSEKDRDFLNLYFRRGLPAIEVAQTLNISIKTVYSKTNKLRRKLLALAEEQSLAPAAA